MLLRRTVLSLLVMVGCSADNHTRRAYDLLITGGTIVDGSGAAPLEADVAVRGDEIVLLSTTRIPDSEATHVIDARGRIVAPGFIDLHAHLDPLLELPDAESHVRQGVTTALGGPDGSSPWPIAAYLDSVESIGVGMNVAFLVGHNTIRGEVMGMANRAPTSEELARMEGMVDEAMQEGAWGLSTGLKYLPGAFAQTDEIVALATRAAAAGGIYTSHLREEGLGLIDAVREAIDIGRRADIPVVLTHHKVVGAPMWGASVTTLAMIDSARAAGIDVMADQYPYTATYTGTSILIPAWALAGGHNAFLQRLDDPGTRDSIVSGIVFNILNDRGGGDLERVQLALVPWQPELEGQTLADWARLEGLAPTPENGAELAIEAEKRGGASAIYHVLDESDVTRIMRYPWTAIASDGRLTEPGRGHPHPRWYGTFPRVLARYVREQGVLTLPDAIRKMTSLPAGRLGIMDRGVLASGKKADIVIFDPTTVVDRATFENPHQYPDGIDYVIVNGVMAVEDGVFTGTRGGKVLRKAS
jgi:N-acyl-D-aspartate/D-glutamate deacylase